MTGNVNTRQKKANVSVTNIGKLQMVGSGRKQNTIDQLKYKGKRQRSGMEFPVNKLDQPIWGLRVVGWYFSFLFKF